MSEEAKKQTAYTQILCLLRISYIKISSNLKHFLLEQVKAMKARERELPHPRAM